MINNFIAWDKFNKRMMPPFTIQNCVHGLDTPFDEDFTNNLIYGLDESSYDVLQSTGKKDREGNPIYEGFFVKHWVNGHKVEPDEIVSLVEWDENNLTYFPLGGENGCGSNCVIVGNVYENPELLKSLI